MFATGQHPLQRIGMAAPSRRYLATVIDPFNKELALTAKVPSGPSHSQTVPVTTTVDVTIGMNGCGWICAMPNVAGADAYTHTTVDYTGYFRQGIQRMAVFNGLTNSGVIRKPYTTAQLDAGYNASNADKAMGYRLVAAGIQASYIGSAQNRAGVCYALHTTTNDDLSNVNPMDLIAAEPQIAKYNCNNQDVYTVAWRAKTPHELEFRDSNSANSADYGYGKFPSCSSLNNNYWDNASNGKGSPGTSYGLIWSGCVPGTVFTCTIGESWEFMGGAVGLLATPIYHDVAGLAHVNTIAHAVDLKHAQAPHISRTDHTMNAIEDIAGALEPEMALAAGAFFGPGGAAAVEGFNSVMSKARDPINHLIGEGLSSIRDIFHI